MIRDKETDWLLLQLRTFFNRCNYAALREHALLMSDWLKERGRPLEAAALRSGRWMLLIMEGHGWPPPCEVVAEYVPGTHRQIYMDSDYITSADLLGQIADSPDAGTQGAALLKPMGHAVDAVGLGPDLADGPGADRGRDATSDGGAS